MSITIRADALSLAYQRIEDLGASVVAVRFLDERVRITAHPGKACLADLRALAGDLPRAA